MSRDNMFLNEVSSAMYEYHNEHISCYEFVHRIAEAQKKFGNYDAGIAIEGKLKGIVEDFAVKMVMELMGVSYFHNNNGIRSYIEAYLYHAVTPKVFIEGCINCWENDDIESHQKFGYDMKERWDNAVYPFAQMIYNGAAKRMIV